MARDLRTAETAFAEAEAAHRRRQMPFELARTWLCRGEVVRRLRRPAAARVPLRDAYAAFARLGAKPWARRAAAELTASGDRGAQTGHREVGQSGLDGSPPPSSRSPAPSRAA